MISFQAANLAGVTLADAVLALANLKEDASSKTQCRDMKLLSDAIWSVGSIRD